MSLKLSENYNFSEHLVAHGTLNGVAVPFFATPEFRNELKEKFKLRPEIDVFIVTYPKSGTTWMQNIVRTMLMNEDPPEFAQMKLDDRLPYTDMSLDFPLDQVDEWPSPRAFKSHHSTPAEMDELVFKGNRSAKIIYVLRDPRDVSVSLYHHLKKTALFKFVNEATFDDFHKQYMRNKETAVYGLWEKHVDSWLSKKDEFNMLVIRYEDMIENSPREIEKVAKFVGLNLSSSRIAEIAELTSFAKVTSKGDFFKDESGVTNSILRKGVAGDWRNHFQDKDEAIKMGSIAQELYQKYNLIQF